MLSVCCLLRMGFLHSTHIESLLYVWVSNDIKRGRGYYTAGTSRNGAIDWRFAPFFVFVLLLFSSGGLFVCHQQSTVWESLLEIAVDILNFDDECAPHVLKVNLWTRLRIHLGLKYLPECSKEPTGCPRPWRNLLPGFRKWKIGRWRRSCCRERATTRRDEPMAAAGQRMPAAAGDRRQKSGNGVMLSYFLDRLPHQRQSRWRRLFRHFLLRLIPIPRQRRHRHHRCCSGSLDCWCTWARKRCPTRCGNRHPYPGRSPAGCAKIVPSIPFLWFGCSSGSFCASLSCRAGSFVKSMEATAETTFEPVHQQQIDSNLNNTE